MSTNLGITTASVAGTIGLVHVAPIIPIEVYAVGWVGVVCVTLVLAFNISNYQPQIIIGTDGEYHVRDEKERTNYSISMFAT